jgi:hypothetical protein
MQSLEYHEENERGENYMITGFFGPGSSGQQQELWSPMVNFDLIDKDNNGKALQTGLVAVIDTGSDFCRIDSALANKYNLVPTREVRDRSGGFTGMVKVYFVLIHLSDGTALQLNCASGQFRELGFGFDFLLGMDAIGHFELLVAKPRQEVTLRLI